MYAVRFSSGTGYFVRPTGDSEDSLRFLPHRLDEPANDGVGVHAVGASVEVEDQAVAEHRAGQVLDVVEIDVVLARENRPCLRAQNQVLRGPWARPVEQVLVDSL